MAHPYTTMLRSGSEMKGKRSRTQFLFDSVHYPRFFRYSPKSITRLAPRQHNAVKPALTSLPSPSSHFSFPALRPDLSRLTRHCSGTRKTAIGRQRFTSKSRNRRPQTSGQKEIRASARLAHSEWKSTSGQSQQRSISLYR